MKRFYSRFRIFLMTFALGSAGVFIFNGSPAKDVVILEPLPQTEHESVFPIITKQNWQGFESIGSGCGGRNIYGGEGGGTGYRNANFETVSVSYSRHDSSQDLKREIEMRIKDAVNILENIESKDIRTRRIILERMNEDEKQVDLITYTSPKIIKVVSSKSLELTDDFLKWEKTRDKQLKENR